eukprot:1285386-Pyramimonas_sp.AAC.1
MAWVSNGPGPGIGQLLGRHAKGGRQGVARAAAPCHPGGEARGRGGPAGAARHGRGEEFMGGQGPQRGFVDIAGDERLPGGAAGLPEAHPEPEVPSSATSVAPECAPSEAGAAGAPQVPA